MLNDPFIDGHENILLSIESAVMGFYRKHPDLVDYNVDKVYEAIQRAFEKELQGKNPPKLRLKGLEEDLHENILGIYNVMIGEETVEDEQGNEITIGSASKEIIINCLKRLRKSIKT
jgi:hypothetical protein